jgi:aryl-alcohol dehydrogenase-like predicted oxidoreductase
MNERTWTRREALAAGLAGAAGAALARGARAAEPLPQRELGKTGVRVPVLGYGTAPTGVKRELKDAIALYNQAIDAGVTYFDTAPELGGYGKAQLQLGHVLKERRKEVFLVTKLWEPRMDDALRLLASNLKELQTDHADLVYAHSIGSDKMDPAIVLGREGTMAALEKARKDGLTRFIGITGHNRPDRFLRVLDQFAIDVMMNAVNLADQYTYGFEHKVWPVARQKGVGLVAMKVFGGMGSGGNLSSSTLPVEHLPLGFRYALSLPGITTAVIGMASEQELKTNVAAARAFKPLTDADRQQVERLGRTLAARWGPHFGAVT